MLRNRAYMLMWCGALISSFGDSLTLFGLAWYVLGRSHNPLEVGLTFLIFDLPGLFSGLLVGWALDRFRREAVMLVDNILRGGLVLLIPLLDGVHMLSLPALYIIIALLGTLSVITQVGTPALITELVPPEDYNTANSLEVMQRQISFIAGPGLARALECTRFACLLAFQQYRREGIKLGVSSLQDKGSRSSLLLQILYFGYTPKPWDWPACLSS